MAWCWPLVSGGVCGRSPTTLPKPLVPLAGKTLLDRALDQLQAVNVSAATVNLHYLGDMIEDHLAARSEPQDHLLLGKPIFCWKLVAVWRPR